MNQKSITWKFWHWMKCYFVFLNSHLNLRGAWMQTQWQYKTFLTTPCRSWFFFHAFLLFAKPWFDRSASPWAQAPHPCRSPTGSVACEAWRWSAGWFRWGTRGWRQHRRMQRTMSSSTRSRWFHRCQSCVWQTVSWPPLKWLCRDLKRGHADIREESESLWFVWFPEYWSVSFVLH